MNRVGVHEETRNRRAAKNPFASRRVRPGAIPFYFPAGLTAENLVARLSRLGWRGAIVGPHGAGKSTLLAALAPELVRAGRPVRSIALHDGQRCLPDGLLAKLPTDEIVVVDGYDQLSYWSRWRLDRRCRAAGSGLLVTSHGPAALPLLIDVSPNAELAERIVAYLLTRDDDRGWAIDRTDICRAWTKHGGNVREMLFDFYDVYERQRC